MFVGQTGDLLTVVCFVSMVYFWVGIGISQEIMGEFVLMNKYKQIDPNMMYGEMIKCVFVDAVEVKQQ